MASRYDLITLQNWAAQRAPNIKRLNPKARILFYRFAHGTWDWQENWDEINAHESWFMHAPLGQRTRHADPNDAFYLMDIRNPEFRAYQIRYIMKFVNTYGFDGVFWDGPPGTIMGEAFSPMSNPSAVATWHRDILIFLWEMKQALGSKLLVTNSTPIHDSGVPGADDSDFLAYVDGTMMEGFGHAPWEPATSTPDDTWFWQQKMAKRNISAGKILDVISGLQLEGTSPDQVHRWQIFTLASFLLRTDGVRGYYQWGPWGTDEQAPIFPEMNVNLGAPLREASSNGAVYQRDFARGKVVVNASDRLHAIELGSPFRLPNGPTVSRITLKPWTAAILIK
jgi:hypothetical protein